MNEEDDYIYRLPRLPNIMQPADKNLSRKPFDDFKYKNSPQVFLIKIFIYCSKTTK